MKELTIEEKAKAYDRAFERAKKLHETCDSQAVVGWCEYIFPELHESEDEKVREDIISLVNEFWERIGSINPEYSSRNRMLAWLEKQANHANFRNKIRIGDKVTRNRDGVIVNLSQLNRVAKKDEKQSESYTKKDVDDAFVEGMALAKDELEKQGEQKSVGDGIVEALRTEYEKGRADAFAQMQKGWSEDDEKMLNSIIEDFGDGKTSNMLQEYWLKLLKERIGE